MSCPFFGNVSVDITCVNIRSRLHCHTGLPAPSITVKSCVFALGNRNSTALPVRLVSSSMNVTTGAVVTSMRASMPLVT